MPNLDPIDTKNKLNIKVDKEQNKHNLKELEKILEIVLENIELLIELQDNKDEDYIIEGSHNGFDYGDMN